MEPEQSAAAVLEQPVELRRVRVIAGPEFDHRRARRRDFAVTRAGRRVVAGGTRSAREDRQRFASAADGLALHRALGPIAV